mmetsp:Transcript_151791/g.487055  ORF Transcript_151791/g.487055 Transcript_151791/m.487055 type:complete len:404 (-) Transcript_151791:120-1331(-)
MHPTMTVVQHAHEHRPSRSTKWKIRSELTSTKSSELQPAQPCPTSMRSNLHSPQCEPRDSNKWSSNNLRTSRCKNGFCTLRYHETWSGIQRASRNDSNQLPRNVQQKSEGRHQVARRSSKKMEPPTPKCKRRVTPSCARTSSSCTIASNVRPFVAARKFAQIWPAVLLSNALVNSSKSTIGGSATIKRAIAMRCFSPPDNCTPCSPTCVSRPRGKRLMTSSKPAARTACSKSMSVRPQPSTMFSAMLPETKIGSCGTIPTRPPRKRSCGTSRMSMAEPWLRSGSSNFTAPLSTSYNRESSRNKVDLPQPLTPVMPTRSPGAISIDILSRVATSGRAGYANETASNRTPSACGRAVKSLKLEGARLLSRMVGTWSMSSIIRCEAPCERCTSATVDERPAVEKPK